MRHAIVRTIGAFALSAATVIAASAQQTGSITGTVTAAETGQPLAGAQVYIAGTQLGMLSSESGRFLILNVPAGQQRVQVQLLGYATQSRTVTVTAGASTTVDFQLASEAVQVEGLVVTALGIKKEERSLGYAVQGVGENVLQTSPQTNLVEALQGQTAGVQVVQASGRPGASSRITIRGESSFTGGGQPLFIIDGVPVSTALDGSAGLNPLGSGSAGNRGMDFDMQNVSSVSVLRGAAATALYGSRAANGAVIIETRKGQAGSPLRFEINSTASFDNAILGGYVTDWGAGQDGYFCDGLPAQENGWCEPGYPGTVPDLNSLQGWGPHQDSLSSAVTSYMGGQVKYQDARDAFYQTAKSTQNSLRALGSMGQMGTYTFGISYTDQRGITTVGKLQRLNLNANIDLNLSSYLHSTTSVQRIHTYNPWSNDSWNSIHRKLRLIPPSVDYTGYQWHEDGTPVLWGNNDPSYDWIVNNEYQESTVDRWILSQRFAVDIMPGLTLANTWGLDTYQDYRQQHQNERPWRTAEGLTSGGTAQTSIDRTQINDDLILSLDNLRFGEDLTLSGLVGGNIFMEDNSRIAATGSNINIPDYYNIENFATQRVSADLPEKRRLIGLYGQATLDYKDYAFLTFTGRNDWSSTLPKSANNYFYPSVSLGFVFTDALDWHPSWLPYGKLRFSVAKVGNDAPPYSLASSYSIASAQGADNAIQQFSGPSIQFPFRGQVGFFQRTQLGNPNIKPESTTEEELGLELRMFNNRVRLDASAYNKKSYDQIFTVPSSPATGYSSIVRNAGSLRNRGVEVSLDGTVLQKSNFSWDARVNWTLNRNDVLELAPGVTNIILAGYSWPNIRIQEDEGYGVAYGYGFQRNCDEKTSSVCFPDQPTGALLIGDADCVSDRGGTCYGFPLRTESQINLGSVQPEWLANITNTVRWGAWGLSGMIDIRRGSRILNFETQYTSDRSSLGGGRSFVTEDRYSTTVIEGINVNTGQPNTVTLTKDPHYYQLMYGYDRHENQMEPGGYVKLRQITLSYDVPRTALGRVGVESATLYVTGRNLWIHSRFSQIDPEGDLYGGANAAGQFFWQFPAPQTKGVTVGLRAGF